MVLIRISSCCVCRHYSLLLYQDSDGELYRGSKYRVRTAVIVCTACCDRNVAAMFYLMCMYM